MILLTRTARQMIELAVAKEPSLEVSGFGRAEIQDDMIVVKSIFIPPQEVSSAHTDVEGDDLRQALEALLRAGTTLAQWPVWWHSHCNMSVGPSDQDRKTLALLADEVPNLGWFAGIVTNTKQEYHGWLEITKPLPLSTEVDVYHEQEVTPRKLTDQVNKMMEQVKRRTYASAGWPKGKNAHSTKCVCPTCMKDLQGPLTRKDEEELIREMQQSGMFLGSGLAGEDEV